MPVDIVRVEVYGYTGRRPPPPARWVEFGELVASVPVIPPAPPDVALAEPTPVDPSTGALPGTMVTVLEKLSAQKLQQGKVEEAPARGSRTPTPVAAVTAPEPDVLHRFYSVNYARYVAHSDVAPISRAAVSSVTPSPIAPYSGDCTLTTGVIRSVTHRPSATE